METDKLGSVIRLPVLPLRDVVVFPYMVFPVLVGRVQSMNAASAAMEKNKLIFLLSQKNPLAEDPQPNDLYTEGTVGKIVQTIKMPNNIIKILVDGVAHGNIIKFFQNSDFLEAEISVQKEEFSSTSEENVLVNHLDNLFDEYVKLNKKVPNDTFSVYGNLTEPARKLYYVAAIIEQSVDKKQKLLQFNNLKDKFYFILELLKNEIDVLKIENELDKKIQDKIHKSQRKFLIQEQIRILQDELGEDELSDPEIDKLTEKINNSGMPEAILNKAMEEINKLKKIPPMSPETTVIRNYLDWLISVPWKKRTKDNLDVLHVQKILDEDHYGLEKPKERILEHIAVLNLVKDLK